MIEAHTNKFSALKGKSVLVTGHTGFKGAWLTAWLKLLGANVIGIALNPPTAPSHFDVANMKKGMVDLRLDIRNYQELENAIVKAQPDFVFHLAAQSLVGQSYENPIETWSVNVLGTLHVLESLRKLEKTCAAIMVTSDKCYDNIEWTWGYRESDALGGSDPYSASKAAAEIAIKSYVKSYFPSSTSNVRIASVRAGNVIGGGDWAENRIVPDFISAWSSGELFNLRNPGSTRPWQHVLEPLSGYISLAIDLLNKPELHGEPFNFGPHELNSYSVLQLVNQMSLQLDQVALKKNQISNNAPYESSLLKLNCDKALHYLRWHAVLDFDETVSMTTDWYKSYISDPDKISVKTNEQILHYMKLANESGLSWAL
jgi:CDP-glucose 4,6-dehydratase